MELPTGTLRTTIEQIFEQSANSRDFRSNIEQLLKIYRNIYQAAPHNDKFTKINVEKARTKLWANTPAVKEFMLQTGWQDEGDHIKFTDDKDLRATIDLLATVRTRVSPSTEEWVSNTKIEKVNLLGWQDAQEVGLRQKAAEERKKEHAACLQEMRDRKLLNELIKQELLSDMKHRNQLRQGSS